MTERNEIPAAESVDQVVNRVLLAEREAHQAVEECRAEAAGLLSEAEGRARRVSRNAESRIRSAHRIADKAVTRALRELQGGGEDSVGSGCDGGEGDRLDRALLALVEEIIGGSS